MTKTEIEDYLLAVDSFCKNRRNRCKSAEYDKALSDVLSVINKAVTQIKAEREKERLERIRQQQKAKEIKNTACRHYCEYDGTPYCDIKMDMSFCGFDCAFADTKKREKERRTQRYV